MEASLLCKRTAHEAELDTSPTKRPAFKSEHDAEAELDCSSQALCDPADVLPYELMLRVFEFVGPHPMFDSLMLVSKTWHWNLQRREPWIHLTDLWFGGEKLADCYTARTCRSRCMLLCQRYSECSDDRSKMWNWAVENNLHRVVDRLLRIDRTLLAVKVGDSINALYRTANAGQYKTLKVLLEHKADVTAHRFNGATPLNTASFNGHRRTVRALLAAKADPNHVQYSGSTALHQAAWNGQAEIVDMLIAAGADVTRVRVDAVAPLHIAVHRRHRGIVESLLDAKASINCMSTTGLTPLLSAVAEQSPEICELLLERGADPNLANHDGRTPLYTATLKRNDRIVKALLDAKASVDCVSTDGWTPLLAAVAERSPQICELLLQHGANANLANIHGQTPLKLAVRLCDSDIIAMLLSHVCNSSVQTAGASGYDAQTTSDLYAVLLAVAQGMAIAQQCSSARLKM